MKSAPQRVKDAHARLWRRLPALRPAPARPAPEPGRLVLGRDKAGVPFGFDRQMLSAHMDMVGGTGGGKSMAMRHLAWLHMESDPMLNQATIVIDPHGHHEDGFLRTTLRRIVDTGLHLRRNVFVIDANSEFCTGLRLLGSNAQPSVMADHMIEGFERLQGDESLLEKPTLRRALHGLLAVLTELNWSLAEADVLLDPQDPHGVRAWALERIKDRYAKKALTRLQYLSSDPRLLKEMEIETIGTENRLAPLLSSPAMRAIVGSQTINMQDVLDQGAVLLVNTAGHDTASEVAGDLLGKLVMRAILFAAKRRRINSLALVFADECARYVSQDWERALAELRKYGVGICSAHQTFAMLGRPGDPVRDAVEKIPATKIAFRMNSMQEAMVLAPELVQLNLEMPVEMLRAPAVVGYQVQRMRNGSLGGSATNTRSDSTTDTKGNGLTNTEGETTGVSQTNTHSNQYSLSHGRGRTWDRTHSHMESETESEADSETWGSGRSRTQGGGTSEQQTSARGSNFSQSFDVPVNSWRSGENSYSQAAIFGVASDRQVASGYDRSNGSSAGSSANWSNMESESEAYSSQRSWSAGRADGVATSEGKSENITRGTTHGDSVAKGHHRDRSRSVAQSRQDSRANTTGHSAARGANWAQGWSETMVPVLRKRPTAVHSLQNVTHMAAEMLCSLPTGIAVVRTIHDGRIEGALVKVPYRPCLPICDDQYAEDLRTVVSHCGGAKSMVEATAEIERREREIVGMANARSLVEPQSFRTPMPKPKKGKRLHKVQFKDDNDR